MVWAYIKRADILQLVHDVERELVNISINANTITEKGLALSSINVCTEIYERVLKLDFEFYNTTERIKRNER